MNVVFHCYGGTHASPVAAALYLGLLPEDRRPSQRHLLSLALFDRVEPKDFGRLIPVGRDSQGNGVFVLGCGRHGSLVLKALEGFLSLTGGNPDEWVLADVYPCINPLMRVGGFTSRVLKLVWLGRPLVAFGAWLAYPKLCHLARETRRRVEGRTRGAAAG